MWYASSLNHTRKGSSENCFSFESEKRQLSATIWLSGWNLKFLKPCCISIGQPLSYPKIRCGYMYSFNPRVILGAGSCGSEKRQTSIFCNYFTTWIKLRFFKPSCISIGHPLLYSKRWHSYCKNCVKCSWNHSCQLISVIKHI